MIAVFYDFIGIVVVAVAAVVVVVVVVVFIVFQNGVQKYPMYNGFVFHTFIPHTRILIDCFSLFFISFP